MPLSNQNKHKLNEANIGTSQWCHSRESCINQIKKLAIFKLSQSHETMKLLNLRKLIRRLEFHDQSLYRERSWAHHHLYALLYPLLEGHGMHYDTCPASNCQLQSASAQCSVKHDFSSKSKSLIFYCSPIWTHDSSNQAFWAKDELSGVRMIIIYCLGSVVQTNDNISAAKGKSQPKRNCLITFYRYKIHQ